MSIFSFLSNIFTPVSKIVDDLHFSGEEKGNIEIKKAELQNKLAEIESKIGLRLMELQSESLRMQAEMERAIQEHGNWLTKSIRPLLSLASFGLIVLMGLNKIPRDELILQICGGYLGIYCGLRTYEKKK